MTRRYLATLAAAAVLVLAGGLLIRRSLVRAETLAPTAPPSEASALQQLSQEGQLRRTAEFVAQRVAAVAPFVTYLPETGAAGLRWRDSLVISTRVDRPVVALRRPEIDTVGPSPEIAGDSVAPGWVLVVGRDPDGQVVSATGLAARVACGEHEVEAYVLSAPLAEHMAGAGLFTVDGRLLGAVVRCPERLVAVPGRELRRLRAESERPGFRVREIYGVTMAALDAPARAYFGSDSGVLVTAVRQGSVAAAAGLQAGDVVLAAAGMPTLQPEALAALVDSAATDTLVLTRRRGRTTSTVRLPRRPAAVPGAVDAVGIDVTPAASPRGVAITGVRIGSTAAAAGLRAGDQLLRVGTAAVRTPADARRLLAAADTLSTFVVFERAGVERGVLVSPPPAVTPR